MTDELDLRRPATVAAFATVMGVAAARDPSVQSSPWGVAYVFAAILVGGWAGTLAYEQVIVR